MIDEHQLRLSYILSDLERDHNTNLNDWVYEQLVNERIRCDEVGYPSGEALYWSIHEWEEENKFDFEEYLRNLLADAT